MIRRLMKWLRCLFGHNWLHYNWSQRTCSKCGKKQDATYDMMYGTTQWEDSEHHDRI